MRLATPLAAACWRCGSPISTCSGWCVMVTARNPAALIRPLITPEGVDLRVKLADAGTRAAAFLLDLVIIITAAFVVSLVLLFGLGGLGVKEAEPLFIVWIIFIFLLRNAYFIA